MHAVVKLAAGGGEKLDHADVVDRLALLDPWLAGQVEGGGDPLLADAPRRQARRGSRSELGNGFSTPQDSGG
jgi:hypothetical protein